MALFSLLVLLHLTATFAASEDSFEECAMKRNVLLRALYETGNNLNELDKAFYPAGQLPAQFVQVNYIFNNTGIDNCTVSYFWASGGFLLIQPPRIFQFTSLFFWFFSNPGNNSLNITLTLPGECLDLIKYENESCSCPAEEHTALERLTQQVGYII